MFGVIWRVVWDVAYRLLIGSSKGLIVVLEPFLSLRAD